MDTKTWLDQIDECTKIIRGLESAQFKVVESHYRKDLVCTIPIPSNESDENVALLKKNLNRSIANLVGHVREVLKARLISLHNPPEAQEKNEALQS